MTTNQPRHQGGAHGGRAPAKIVRAPAKITGLIMFHLGCQNFFGVLLVLVLKNQKRPNGNPVFHGGWSRRLSHTHSYPACYAPDHLVVALLEQRWTGHLKTTDSIIQNHAETANVLKM